MGISFPDSHCESSPSSAHHYIELVSEIFRCKYCWAAIWQPKWFVSAINFSVDIEKHGLQEAYIRRVSGRPKIVTALHTLNGLRITKGVLSEEEVSEVISTIVDSIQTEDMDFSESLSIRALKKKTLLNPDLWDVGWRR